DIIEAMALKKPIVATGTSEFFIENEKTGYLVSPRDPEQMLAKIIELVNEPEKRKEFGEAGYRKIRQMCDLDEYGKKIFNIYSELLA
ncbi:MAG: glycosyltransferase family 4 protein, partial [Ignavibacterium sp.]|nr:glycosyltransferase family 4 protein [Ignavibacterium sp.]